MTRGHGRVTDEVEHQIEFFSDSSNAVQIQELEMTASVYIVHAGSRW